MSSPLTPNLLKGVFFKEVKSPAKKDFQPTTVFVIASLVGQGQL